MIREHHYMNQQTAIRVSTVLTLLIIWTLLIFSIGDELYNSRDTPRGWVAAAVRNYETYNYDEIGFSIVWNREYVEDLDSLKIYSHHPPLIVWIPAILTQFIGKNVLALKFGFAAAMMVAVSALYTLTRHLHNEKIAFWTLLLFGLAPMTLFFQSMMTHDPLGFAAALLYVLVFYQWIKRPSLIRYIGLIITAILSVWTAWPAVFFVGTIGIYGIIIGKWSHRIGITILGMIAILSFVVMMLLYELWWQGSVSSILEAFVWRTSTASTFAGTESFTLGEWFLTTFHHLAYYATVPVLIFMIIGMPSFWKQTAFREKGFTIALFLSGLIYLIIFRNAGHLHIYYKAFLLPAMSIFAAFGIVYFRNAKPRITRPLVDGLVLAFFIQVIFVMFVAYQTPQRESVEAVIDYINEEDDLIQPIYILFPEAAYRTYMGIEYYTFTRVDWNVLLEEMPETDVPFTYILCYQDQTYIEFLYGGPQPNEEINELCHAYSLNGTPNIDTEDQSS